MSKKKKNKKNKKTEKAVHPVVHDRKGFGRVGIFFNRWMHTMRVTYADFMTL